MKSIAMTFATVALGLSLFGCSQESDGSDPNQPASGADTASESAVYNHNNNPGASDVPGVSPEQRALEDQAAGGAVASARLHACGKSTLMGMETFMRSRGASNASIALVTNAANAAALGQANYAARVPEAAFASASALSKAFDIYVTASTDIVAANWAPTGCPGTKLLENGKFTKDGVSCILGKPAKPEHLALADDLVAQADTPADGQRLAVAALLAAASTCE